LAQSGLEALQQDAPPNLSAQVTSIVTAESPLLNAIIKVNGDTSKVPASAYTAIQTPSVAQAGQALSQYATQTCGLKLPQAPAPSSTTPPSTSAK
jgi:hypothetical protein